MQAQSMTEDYYVIIKRWLPYGSYNASRKVYDDREKAKAVADAMNNSQTIKVEAFVCRVGLPFIYNTDDVKT